MDYTETKQFVENLNKLGSDGAILDFQLSLSNEKKMKELDLVKIIRKEKLVRHYLELYYGYHYI